MINRNYRFSSTLAIRPNLWSNDYDLPEPSKAIHPTPLITPLAAGAAIDLPAGMTVASLGVEVGDIVLNTDYPSAGYGGYTTVATLAGANQITLTDNITLLTGMSFMIFKPGPNKGCILHTLADFVPGSVISVITFGGEYQTWVGNKGMVFPEVLVTRILTVNPYDSSNTATSIPGNYVLAQFA